MNSFNLPRQPHRKSMFITSAEAARRFSHVLLPPPPPPPPPPPQATTLAHMSSDKTVQNPRHHGDSPGSKPKVVNIKALDTTRPLPCGVPVNESSSAAETASADAQPCPDFGQQPDAALKRTVIESNILTEIMNEAEDESSRMAAKRPSVGRRSRRLTIDSTFRRRKTIHSPKRTDTIASDQESVSGMPDDVTASNIDDNQPPREDADMFCWTCHQSRTELACITCPRAFHYTCVRTKSTLVVEASWRCAECVPIIASNSRKLTRDELTAMLKFAEKRFLHAIMNKGIIFPSDPKKIVNEMSLSKIDRRINAKKYSSTAALYSDLKWILHNCIVSGDLTAKKLTAVRNMLRIGKQELDDIELCPECYYNANTCPGNWFEKVCTRPHILLWAKMKCFPYWPAKAMGFKNTGSEAMVDCRFFGEHDRAWVPLRECYLFSKEDPNPPGYKNKRNNILYSLREIGVHIRNITSKYGIFTYAPPKHLYNPHAEKEQLEMLIPNVNKVLPVTQPPPDLTFNTVKTADNNMSMVKKIDLPATQTSPSSSTVQSPGNGRIMVPVEPTKSPPVFITYSSSPSKNSNLNPRVVMNKDPLLHIYRVLNQVPLGAGSENSVNDGKVNPAILKRKSQSCVSPDDPKKIKPETSSQPADVTIPSVLPYDALKDDKNVVVAPVTVNETTPEKLLETPPNLPAEKSPNCTPVVGVSEPSSAEQMSLSTPQPPSLGQPDEADVLLPMMEVKNEDDEPFIDIKWELMSEEELDGPDIVSESPVQPIVEPFIEQPSNNADASTSQSTPTVVPLPPPPVVDQRENVSVKDMSKLSPTAPTTPTQQSSQFKLVLGNAKSKGPKTMEITPQIPRGVSITPNFHNMVYIPMSDGRQFSNEMLISRPKDTTVARPSITITAKPQPPPLTTVSPAPVAMRPMAPMPTTHPTFLNVNVITASPKVITESSTPPCPPSTSSCTPPTSSSPPSPPPAMPTLIPAPYIPPAAPFPPPSDPELSRYFLNELVPDNLARAVSNTLTVGTAPRPVPKPTGPLRSEGVSCSTSVEAGPVSQLLIQNSHKLSDFFRQIIEDTLADLAGTSATPIGDSAEARLKQCQLEMERMRHSHANELLQLRTNTDQIIDAMQKSIEADKMRLVNNVRRQCEIERIRSVEDTKRRQWCIICRKVANFYCCWNTSYCSYKCQQKHFVEHIPKCLRKKDNQCVPTPPIPTPTPTPTPTPQPSSQEKKKSESTTKSGAGMAQQGSSLASSQFIPTAAQLHALQQMYPEP